MGKRHFIQVSLVVCALAYCGETAVPLNYLHDKTYPHHPLTQPAVIGRSAAWLRHHLFPWIWFRVALPRIHPELLVEEFEDDGN